jgi:pilus assembly protein Flp/PilA
MHDWLRSARAALDDDRGATAIEYALLAGLIVAGIIALVATLGENVAGAYEEVGDSLEAAM